VLLISSFFVLATNSVSQASSTDEVEAASGSNRFVVWVNDLGRDTEIFFRRSTDNGASWQPKVSLAPSPMEAFNPQIIVSGSNVYVVWGEFHSNLNIGFVIFIRSTDNGATWGPVQEVSESCSNFFSPQIAVSGSNVFVVWHSGGGECQSANEIHFRRSTDNGATWHPAVNLSNNPGHSSAPLIAASGSNVYVVWTQLNPDETLSDIFFRRSTDNGATWKSKVNISNNVGDSLTPQVNFSGINVYVAWSDDLPTNNDIFVRRSADNGATWKVAKNLSNNPGPSLNPQIAASGSSAHVVWDQRNTGQTLSDVFFRRSTDNGATWNLAKNLSSNGHSGDPDLAVSGSIVYTVWVNSGTGNGDIFLRRSTDNGATWQALKNLSSNTSGSHDPQIGV
jgi:Neuraminidase (sialidase)